MNTPAYDQVQFEQAELAKLEEINRQAVALIQTLQSSPMRPPSDLAAAITQVQQLRNLLPGYDAGATYLSACGRPQLANRVMELTGQFDNTIRILTEMHASAIRHIEELNRIRAGAVDYTTHTIQSVMTAQSNAAQSALKNWSDNAFNKCPRCGLQMPDRFTSFCSYCKRDVR